MDVHTINESLRPFSFLSLTFSYSTDSYLILVVGLSSIWGRTGFKPLNLVFSRGRECPIVITFFSNSTSNKNCGACQELRW